MVVVKLLRCALLRVIDFYCGTVIRLLPNTANNVLPRYFLIPEYQYHDGIDFFKKQNRLHFPPKSDISYAKIGARNHGIFSTAGPINV